MMQLKLVKSEADKDRYMAETREDASHQRRSIHLLYGTKVLIDLVNPWRNTWQEVCADSFFSSITAVNKLDKIGLHFVGVVKTATRKYHLHFLNRNYLHERGDYKKLVSINEDDDIVNAVAMMWFEKNCRFFCWEC